MMMMMIQNQIRRNDRCIRRILSRMLQQCDDDDDDDDDVRKPDQQ